MEPPTTGNPAIDQALAELAESDQNLTIAELHDQLSATHDVLAEVLTNSRDTIQTPIPGMKPSQPQ